MRNLRYALVLAASACAAALAGCGGSSSGGGSSPPPPQPCNPNIPVQAVVPLPGQTGVNTSIGKVILATAAPFPFYTSWNTYIVGNDGSYVTGTALVAVVDSGYPKPYPKPYYYLSSIPALNSGVTYVIQLNNFNTTCSPGYNVNSFAT